MQLSNNNQQENKQVMQEIEQYNRKISVIREFKSDLQKHLPIERIAFIS